MPLRHVLPLALLVAALLSPAAQAQLTFTDAFPGVSFSTPVELAQAPGQPDRVYVVEQGQGGPSRIMTMGVGDAAATVFLDIDDRVSTAGQEMGLLGLAFHPDYEANGRFFVHYTANNPRRSVVSEFARSSADPIASLPGSERVLLEADQPFSNHNGGKIEFGPDGHLYIGIGDGGSGGDPRGNGQNPNTLLGAILRIDVDDVPDGSAYGIPADNPFASGGGRPEIYAYGIRNPWKFSFDPETGDLWLGDVGQNEWEEIDLVVNGGNYGWAETEGPECFGGSCDLSAYEPPVFWYPHTFSGTSGGFSITGGVVYHGTSVAGLEGLYLYADFVRPRLWALAYNPETGEANSTILSTEVGGIASINYGPGGEAYVVTYGGTIYRLEGVVVSQEAGAAGGGPLALVAEGPNPVRGTTAYRVRSDQPVRVTLVDVLGREIAVVHDGPAPAGTRLVVDAAALGLAPGVVFVVAETPGAVRVQRMVVSGTN